METYYHPQDLPKFEEIGEGAPDLARQIIPARHRLRILLAGCAGRRGTVTVCLRAFAE